LENSGFHDLHVDEHDVAQLSETLNSIDDSQRIPNTARSAGESINPHTPLHPKARPLFWMKKHRTFFFFGLTGGASFVRLVSVSNPMV
jgi:hypothetical protein